MDHAATVRAGYLRSQGSKRTKLIARSSVAESVSTSPIQESSASAPSGPRPQGQGDTPEGERGAEGLQHRQRLQRKGRGDDYGRQRQGSEDHGAARPWDIDHSGAEHP